MSRLCDTLFLVLELAEIRANSVLHHVYFLEHIQDLFVDKIKNGSNYGASNVQDTRLQKNL
jgi:hypothetical protein